MSRLDKYIENKDKALVQAYLGIQLIKEIEKYKNKKKLSWSDLINALFERLKDEEGL